MHPKAPGRFTCAYALRSGLRHHCSCRAVRFCSWCWLFSHLLLTKAASTGGSSGHASAGMFSPTNMALSHDSQAEVGRTSSPLRPLGPLQRRYQLRPRKNRLTAGLICLCHKGLTQQALESLFNWPYGVPHKVLWACHALVARIKAPCSVFVCRVCYRHFRNPAIDVDYCNNLPSPVHKNGYGNWA